MKPPKNPKHKRSDKRLLSWSKYKKRRAAYLRWQDLFRLSVAMQYLALTRMKENSE